MNLTTDVEYKADSERGYLDVMTPDGDGPFPVVACIHGGGWAGGEKEGMTDYAEILVDLGIACIQPNYRLTGTDCHPAQQDDVSAALDWMVAHAGEYGFDTTRVGLTGVSAGGHLTALVGVKATARTDTGYTVRCMYPVCPAVDMVPFVRDNPDINDAVTALVGGPLAENADAANDVSVTPHVHAGAPPCVATHGEADGLVPCNQSVMLVDALRAVGVEAEAILVPGVDHAAFMPDTGPAEPLGGIAPFREFFTKHLLTR